MDSFWNYVPILIFFAFLVLLLWLHGRQRRTSSDWMDENRKYQDLAMANQQRLIEQFDTNNRLLAEIRDRLARGPVP